MRHPWVFTAGCQLLGGDCSQSWKSRATYMSLSHEPLQCFYHRNKSSWKLWMNLEWNKKTAEIHNLGGLCTNVLLQHYNSTPQTASMRNHDSCMTTKNTWPQTPLPTIHNFISKLHYNYYGSENKVALMQIHSLLSNINFCF